MSRYLYGGHTSSGSSDSQQTYVRTATGVVAHNAARLWEVFLIWLLKTRSAPVFQLGLALTTVKLHRKAQTEASDVCKPTAWVKYPNATHAPTSMPVQRTKKSKRTKKQENTILDKRCVDQCNIPKSLFFTYEWAVNNVVYQYTALVNYCILRAQRLSAWLRDTWYFMNRVRCVYCYHVLIFVFSMYPDTQPPQLKIEIRSRNTMYNLFRLDSFLGTN